MSNMFYQTSKKKLPQNISDCLQPDEVSSNLWTLASVVEGWGKFLVAAIVIIGIISTVISAVVANYFDEALTFPAILISIVFWGLVGFLVYCSYHILALNIGATASIVQNTRISADVALLQLTKDNYTENVANTNTGAADVSTQQHVPENESYTDYWTCKYCHTLNKKVYGQCKKCGKYRV